MARRTFRARLGLLDTGVAALDGQNAHELAPLDTQLHALRRLMRQGASVPFIGAAHSSRESDAPG